MPPKTAGSGQWAAGSGQLQITTAQAAADELIEACRSNDAECVQNLLALGTSTDTAGSLGLTPLVAAAEHGAAAVVKSLLDAGANANLPLLNGNFPLRAGLISGDGPTILLLVEHPSINLDQETSRGTALMTAASQDDVESCRLLLSCGATVGLITRDGLTALMVAVREDRRQSVRLLLQRGADPHQLDPCRYGRSAIDIAQAKALPEVYSLLMQASITNAADTALATMEEGQQRGMREALERQQADQLLLNEETARSKVIVSAKVAELQAEKAELKRRLGLA